MREEHLTAQERADETYAVAMRIAALEQEYNYAGSDLSREIIHKEILRCRDMLKKLTESREKAEAEPVRTGRRSSKGNFYLGCFILGAVFVISGAFAGAGLVALVMAGKYFTDLYAPQRPPSKDIARE